MDSRRRFNGFRNTSSQAISRVSLLEPRHIEKSHGTKTIVTIYPRCPHCTACSPHSAFCDGVWWRSRAGHVPRSQISAVSTGVTLTDRNGDPSSKNPNFTFCKSEYFKCEAECFWSVLVFSTGFDLSVILLPSRLRRPVCV